MPARLFDSAESSGGQTSKADDAPPAEKVVYERQGMVNWKGRYALESKAASHNKASKQSKRKTGERGLRQRSEHEFMV